MKEIRKMAKYIVLLCFLTGALCACQEGQRANTGVTPVPAEGTGTPLPTPEGERIPIDEAHFTSAVFREFIAEKYDTDADGFLSWAERGAVTEMLLGESDYYFGEECLDGFEYFPNLIGLDVSNNCFAEQVLIRNHPSLQRFGGSEGGGIGTLQIENCPALTSIGFYIYRIDSLSVSGAPLAALSLEYTRIGSMSLDADMMLWGSALDRYGDAVYRTNEDGVLIYYENKFGDEEPQQTPVEFTNRKEPQFPFSEEYWTEYLENSEFVELELFRVQISEKKEAGYNEKGQKGYAVRVFYTRSNHDYGDKTFVIYADEMPVREQFVFRPAAISQIGAVEYSPNRGGCVLTKWDLAFIYRGGEEEQVLDIFDQHEHYCVIAADGAVKAIPVSRYRDSLLRSILTDTKEPTQEATVTTLPPVTEKPLPTPTPVPTEERISIDEAHFTSAVFREFIHKSYDKNRDMMLSKEEREAVKAMDLSVFWDEDLKTFWNERFSGETLDGFENFPCLEELYIEDADKLIIQGHPALRSISGTENVVSDFTITDCPVLERVGFHTSSFGNVLVKNCPELKYFGAANVLQYNPGAVWEFSGTPQLTLDLDAAPDRLVLDADVALKAYYGSFEPEFFTFNEEQLCYLGTEVEWINASGTNIPFSVSPEMEQRLEEKASQMYKLAAVSDNRASSTEGNRLVVLEKASGEEGSVYVRFYSKKEQPVLEDFSFSYNGKTVIDEYSPNRAITQHWEGWISLIYEEDGEKQELSKWEVKTGPVVLFADGSTKEYDLWEQWPGRDESRD